MYHEPCYSARSMAYPVLVSNSGLDLVEHHRGGGRRRSINATNAEAPSMRLRIDAADLHANALRALPDTIGDPPPVQALSDVWPITLNERSSQ